jgi:hypothetical protein
MYDIIGIPVLIVCCRLGLGRLVQVFGMGVLGGWWGGWFGDSGWGHGRERVGEVVLTSTCTTFRFFGNTVQCKGGVNRPRGT